MTPEQKIKAIIAKGYRYPHDIERLAGNIYGLLCAGKLKNRAIVQEFISSINSSKFPNILGITFNYLIQISNDESNLLYEEYEKIGHLFDSINILIELGVPQEDGILKKSDAVILNVLKRKKGKVLISNFNSGKAWWLRISKKYL
ncbi:TPA: hypothetical protein J5G91_004717, partial [Escherichia coli]|nr:hypothetical protein [Escherichia coli]